MFLIGTGAREDTDVEIDGNADDRRAQAERLIDQAIARGAPRPDYFQVCAIVERRMADGTVRAFAIRPDFSEAREIRRIEFADGGVNKAYPRPA